MTTQNGYDPNATIDPPLTGANDPNAVPTQGGMLVPVNEPVNLVFDPATLEKLGAEMKSATALIKQGSPYYEFTEPGTKVRAIYGGITPYEKQDGTMSRRAHFVSQKEDGTWWSWVHSGTILVDAVEPLNKGTLVEITYTGSKKHSTKVGANVKLYDVVVLRSAVAAPPAAAGWDGARVKNARAYLMTLKALPDNLGLGILSTVGGAEAVVPLDESQITGFRRGCAAIFEALVNGNKGNAAEKLALADSDYQRHAAAIEGLSVIEKMLNNSAVPF